MAKQPRTLKHTGSVSVFASDSIKNLSKHATGHRTQRGKQCPSLSPLLVSTAMSSSCWRTAGLSWIRATWFWCQLTTPLSLYGVCYFVYLSHTIKTIYKDLTSRKTSNCMLVYNITSGGLAHMFRIMNVCLVGCLGGIKGRTGTCCCKALHSLNRCTWPSSLSLQ